MPGVADSLLAADQVVGHQRTIRPRQHVVVQRVHLAERRAHLADLRTSRPPGSAGNVMKPSSSSTPSSPNDDEEVGARVRIDDRLKRRLGLVHLERRLRVHRVASGRAQEVADDGDVGVEHLRRGRTAVDRQRTGRTAGAFGAGRNLRRRLRLAAWLRRRRQRPRPVAVPARSR